MKYLADKINAGVVTLSHMSAGELIQLSSDTDCWLAKNMIACELTYRPRNDNHAPKN